MLHFSESVVFSLSFCFGFFLPCDMGRFYFLWLAWETDILGDR